MKQNPATNKNIHCMLTRSNCRMQNTCFFLNSEHNIYAFTYIHIIFLKARSWPPLYTELVSIFPLFCLVRLSQVMLSQLKTKFSLDEIQRGYAEEVRFCSGSIRKALEWTGSPACALQALRPGLWVPAEQPGLTAHRWPRGEPCGLLAHDNPKTHPPQSPNLEIQWGYSLKSIF